MIKVLVFGTFDGLHEGHLDFFRQALRVASLPQGKLQNTEKPYLVVVVGRDSTVQRVKNRPSKFNEQERLKEVQNCRLVNEARLGDEEHNPYHDPYTIMKEINPDVVCLGYDQANFVDKLKKELKEMNLNIEVKILKPHKPEIYKSSIINNHA